MIDPLQEFSFQESNYERPNQEWECGWAAQGESCHIGPNGSGICQAHRECVPYKDGDRYKCARPSNFGGKCELGPRPDGICAQRVVECQPARTLRHRRKLFTYTVTALALGCCLIMFGGTWSNSISSPGELTLQHHSNQHDCADCHTAAAGGFTEWISSAMAADSVANDSRKCLRCHDRLGPQPLMAHGLDTQHLQSLTAAMKDSNQKSNAPLIYSLVDAAARNPLDEKNGLACALCHHEHRGSDFDLTRMTNTQCQSCHTSQFHSFASGHPEFDGFPYKRRTRIYFDHVTHYRVHFKSFERVKPGAVVPAALRDYGQDRIPSAESCTACHLADSSGKMMPIQSFEHSCAACHGAEIEDDTLPGIELLAIPGVAMDQLSESGPAFGQWPQLQPPSGASQQHRGGISYLPSILAVPPLMELMLASDTAYIKSRNIIAEIKANADGTWPELNEEQTAAALRVAWSIKRLIHELITEGEAAGARRLSDLESLIGKDADSAHLDAFSAALFHDPTFVNSLKQAQQLWFPDLNEDIKSLNDKSLPAASAKAIEPSETAGEPSAGWYVTPLDGTIRYRPKGHSDRLMRAVLDLAGRVPDPMKAADKSDAGPTTKTESARRSLSELFALVGDPTASYRCLGCHTADKEDDGRLRINWVGRHVSPDAQSFTKFSHAPHITLLVENNCGECHVPQDDVKFARQEFVRFRDGYSANTDPHASLTSGFAPVKREFCANCHTTELAGDSCLKCHNYHIFK